MKDLNTIHLIDQTSERDHHMVFNTSMIKILRSTFPNNSLIYYGIPSNIDSIKSLLNADEINHIDFRNVKYTFTPNSTFLKILNYGIKEIHRISSFIRLLNNSSSKDLIVLSITTFTSFLGFKFLKIFYPVQTIAVLHGDVDFVYNSKGLLSKINGLVHKIIFKIPAKNFKYLTLNKIEKQILVEDGYLQEQEVLEIEHPFLNIKEVETNHIPQHPLSFGHIGSMEIERKNSHLTFQLAELSKELIHNHRVEFKSIGLMTPSILPYMNEFVDVIVGNSNNGSPQYLTRAQYEIELEKLDYILFFYPKSEYIFRASGAVVDFLAKNKPIICLKHPLFEYMFSKAGNIGYMCNDVFEMQHIIEKISSPDYNLTQEYTAQINNIKTYREDFKISNVAKDFKNQLYDQS